MNARLLIVASTEKKRPDSRQETCDHCGKALWLHPNGVRLLDDAEDEGRESEVSCIPCAANLYGGAFVMAIHANQEAE